MYYFIQNSRHQLARRNKCGIFWMWLRIAVTSLYNCYLNMGFRKETALETIFVIWLAYWV
jgi:hypothetical protein